LCQRRQINTDFRIYYRSLDVAVANNKGERLLDLQSEDGEFISARMCNNCAEIAVTVRP